MFPRLEPGRRGTLLSDLPNGAGIPRLKSPTGGFSPPGGGGGRDVVRGRERLGPQPAGGNGGPGGKNGPQQNRAGNKLPQNANDALGKGDELFPEAGNVDNPLNDPDLGLNPGDGQPNDPRNNEQAGNPAAANDPQNPAKPPPPPPNENRANDPNAEKANRPEKAQPQNADEALPAPTPRERSEARSDSSFRRPGIGAFAEFVGAMFHLLAWAILARFAG